MTGTGAPALLAGRTFFDEVSARASATDAFIPDIEL
jgi:hypothetical protein